MEAVRRLLVVVPFVARAQVLERGVRRDVVRRGRRGRGRGRVVQRADDGRAAALRERHGAVGRAQARGRGPPPGTAEQRADGQGGDGAGPRTGARRRRDASEAVVTLPGASTLGNDAANDAERPQRGGPRTFVASTSRRRRGAVIDVAEPSGGDAAAKTVDYGTACGSMSRPRCAQPLSASATLPLKPERLPLVRRSATSGGGGSAKALPSRARSAR